MQRKFISIIALLLLQFTVSWSSINLVSDDNGIRINIRDLKLKNFNPSDSFQSLTISEDRYVQLNTTTNFKSDEIRLLIALPSDQKLDFNYTILNSSKLNDISLIKTENDAQPFSTKKIDLIQKIEVIEAGMLRGVRTALIRIQPFTYNSESRTVDYIKDLDLRINFKIPKVKQLSLEENNGIYLPISNQNQIHSILNYELQKSENKRIDKKLSNSWYSPSKTYITIKTTKDGIAFTNGADIITVEPSFNNKNIEYFHLLYRGYEIPVSIIEPSGNLTTDTKMIFFGRRPEADTTWFDSYTNDAVFFLYYDENVKGKRYSEFPKSSDIWKQRDYVNIYLHLEKELIYHRGFPQEPSETITGEGWFYCILSPNGELETVKSFELPILLHPYTKEDNKFEITNYFASSKWEPYTPSGVLIDTTHRLTASLNGKEFSDKNYTWGYRDSIKFTGQGSELINGINKFNIKSLGIVADWNNSILPQDQIGIDYFTVRGKVLPIIDSGYFHFYIEPSPIENTTLKIKGFRSNSAIIVDTANSLISQLEIKDSIASMNFPMNYSASLVINEETLYEKAKIEIVNSTDLLNKNNQADVLVITHKNFIQSAKRYAKYRKTTNPDLNFMVIDVDDIYKEFLYGRKSPHAIKNLIKYSIYNWKSPKPTFVTIFGDANWDCRQILPISTNIDYVPAFGWPGVDYWYALLDSTNDILPDIFIGRIPANTNEQAEGYIDKLVLNDTINNFPWMKKFLFLTGGIEASEYDQFYNLAKDNFIEDHIIKSDICGDTMIIKKSVQSNTNEADAFKVLQAFNDGSFISFYIGHGSPLVFDLDGWQAPKMNNKGKYGYLTTLSCNTAAFTEPGITCRSEEYLMVPERGFIGTSGSVGVSFLKESVKLGLNITNAINDKEFNPQRFIDALWYAKSLTIYSIEERLTSMDHEYLGDPLIKLKVTHNSDFYFLKDQVKLNSTSGNQLLLDNENSTVSSTLYNLGTRIYSKYNLRMIHEYKGLLDTTTKELFGYCYPIPYNFPINTLDKPGIHKITIIADPENVTNDYKIDNNTITLTFEVFGQNLYPLDPLDNWNVSSLNPVFRMLNPINNPSDYTYKFEIKTTLDSSIQSIKSSQENEITIDLDGIIDWKPNINLSQNSSFWLLSNSINNKTGNISKTNIFPFNTYKNLEAEKVNLKISGRENFVYSGKLENIVTVQNNLLLDEKPHNYSITSIYGNTPLSPDRFCEIWYDGKQYISSGPFEILGIKLVTVSSTDMQVNGVRIFDTYFDAEGSEKFVKYIKDSVKTGDYILLGTNGEWLYQSHLAPKENIGSIDSIKYYLKNFYNSKLADSIVYELGSFSLFARKLISTDTTLEAVNRSRDTAQITNHITEFLSNGTYKTNLIGPAKKWLNFNITSQLDTIGSNLSINIYGSKTNDTKNLVLLKSLDKYIPNQTILLDDIIASDYPYLSFKLGLSRNTNIIKPNISDISISFQPTPELLISKTNSELSNNNLLRGEEFVSKYNIRNISLRDKSDGFALDLRVHSATKEIENIHELISPLDINSSTDISIKKTTDNFDKITLLDAFINDSNKLNEIYTFNNADNKILNIREDTEKPEIHFRLDGKSVKDGDYVTQSPYVEIELYDNSPIEISSVKYIGVGINSPFPGKHDSTFTSYGRQTPLKAKLAFTSEKLKPGDNYFRILASDVAGNRDTLLVRVNVTINGEIIEITNIPNPFTNTTKINFYLKSPDLQNPGSVKIFNGIGEEVRTINETFALGSNEVYWDGRDNNNVSLPSGIYVYVILINSGNYFDPQYGKVVLIR